MATGDNCTISVTDPRYGVTCTQPSAYDCAGVCGGGAYYTCTSGSSSPSCSSSQYEYYVGKQKCTSGSATNSTSCYTCKPCTYTCPTSGYSINTTSCGSGETLKQEDATTEYGCPAKKCGKCEQNEIYWPDVYNIDSFSVIKTGTHCEISGAESASLEYSKGGSYYKGYSASDFRIIGVRGTVDIAAGFTNCSHFNPTIGYLEWQSSYYVYKKDLPEIICQCSDFGSAFPLNADDFTDSILYVTLKHEPTGETKEVGLMME